MKHVINNDNEYKQALKRIKELCSEKYYFGNEIRYWSLLINEYETKKTKKGSGKHSEYYDKQST